MTNQPIARAPQRWLALLSLTLAVPLAATVAVAPAANADNDATLTIVGTSDVYDSNLVQAVLKPGFEAAYPQYTLNYVPKGTGDAINYAKSGAASALIVHAAALENQFVADGYSLESYGRAIFWGDFILAGFDDDPADVVANGHDHDIAQAFEDIAAAGAAGDATFVSRGGTPGTTVQEHAIWAQTSGVALCDIPSGQGGGKAPTNGSADPCGTTGNLPDWYKVTGLNQGANVLAASACNFSPRPADSCYVFTDRGTLNYRQSIGESTNLHIVTRDNTADAVGGPDLLVNSFHAYGINPAKFSSDPAVQINTTAAKAFLDWVTSPAGQTAVGNHLNGTGDAPFLPSAAPAVTASAVPASLAQGQSLTVTGALRNVVPGTPKLDFVPVKLVGTAPGGTPSVVATATTDVNGGFNLSYAPKTTMSYAVVTDQITKIENATLNPIFGDLLAPTTTAVGTTQVPALPAKVTAKAKAKGGKVRFRGTLAPAAAGEAKVLIYVKAAGAKKFTKVAKAKVAPGAETWSKKVKVNPRRFTWYVTYVDPATGEKVTSAKKGMKR